MAKSRSPKGVVSTSGRQLVEFKKLLPPRRYVPLADYWRIGQEMAASGKPACGKGAMEKLAERLGCHGSRLHLCRQFFELWPTRKDLRRLIDRGLLWSHVRTLMSHDLTSAKRERLERYVERQKPSVRELQKKVRATFGRRRRGSLAS